MESILERKENNIMASKKTHDSRKRSLYKTISWHLTHILMVSSIALIVTGSVKIAAILASMEMFFETFVFYAHERFWSKFGKNIK